MKNITVIVIYTPVRNSLYIKISHFGGDFSHFELMPLGPCNLKLLYIPDDLNLC